MTFDSEDLAKLQKAALNGEPLESAGLPITPELVLVFEKLVAQVTSAPKGSMAEIVEDLEWGKWDAFEANNEKWYGSLIGNEPIANQLAKRKSDSDKKRKN
jgi:hypothetical protein